MSKTKGADHLKLASRKLTFVQNYCLDLYAFLAVAAFALFQVGRWTRKNLSLPTSLRLTKKAKLA